MLRTEASFSIYNSEDGGINNEEEIIAGLGSPHFSFGRNSSMSQIQEDDENEDKEEILSELKGLGIGNGAISRNPFAIDFRIDGDGDDVEEFFAQMVKEDPSNPLFLRNYGRILESKGDFHRAEEYYYRATRADPKDYQALLLYANLMWDCHQDKAKASSYFKKASNAAPDNSEVLAAYAEFLWTIDEDDEESSEEDEYIKVEDNDDQMDVHKAPFFEELRPPSPPLHLATGLGINMTPNIDDDAIMEEYYKVMAEGNPPNPLYLSRYAQFLCQVKGDLIAAAEYYARALVADPSKGEVLSQYAQLILDLHGDTQKASSYFNQSVQAAPNDSNVLAAYARFLWEANDEEDEEKEEENNVSKDRNCDPEVTQGMDVSV